MTTLNALQLREQALALLRIERELRSEQANLESEEGKGPAAIHGQTVDPQTRHSSSTGRLFTIQRTAC